MIFYSDLRISLQTPVVLGERWKKKRRWIYNGSIMQFLDLFEWTKVLNTLVLTIGVFAHALRRLLANCQELVLDQLFVVQGLVDNTTWPALLLGPYRPSWTIFFALVLFFFSFTPTNIFWTEKTLDVLLVFSWFQVKL